MGREVLQSSVISSPSPEFMQIVNREANTHHSPNTPAFPHPLQDTAKPRSTADQVLHDLAPLFLSRDFSPFSNSALQPTLNCFSLVAVHTMLVLVAVHTMLVHASSILSLHCLLLWKSPSPIQLSSVLPKHTSFSSYSPRL